MTKWNTSDDTKMCYSAQPRSALKPLLLAAGNGLPDAAASA
ncbi:hypothetical protein MicloDRAFT_00034990 [Microvirga lotononidis]|uniref:Uncharacterized protein n=1 Tax=Microvirga lotononidis TaxID=864069 RepID=I4YSK4_9HYPH|nr:hypothetical protein MicloDRAFT_00034990 [Microvirga lotononidis]